MRPRVPSSLRPLVIPLCYLAAMIVLAPVHQRFDEWGGVMQYFAGREMLAGHSYQGWPAGFWPPLYALLLGVGSLFTSGFVAGKAISILAGTSLLYAAFWLAVELTRRRDVGYLTQLFLPMTPLYAYESLRAHNHMLDAALFTTGLLLFLRAARRSSKSDLLVAGVVCGLAGLTRYTSYVLVLMPLFLLIDHKPRQSILALASAFWAGFAIVSAPWWYANTVHMGSPLHNREELNICAGMFRYQWQAANLEVLWRCNATWPYESAADWFRAYPKQYLGNVKNNAVFSIELLLRCIGVLGLFLVPALIEGFSSLSRKHWAILYSLLALYVLSCCQAVVPEYTYLSWLAPLAAICLLMASHLVEALQQRFPRVGGRRFSVAFFAGLAVLALVSIDFKVKHYSGASLPEAEEVARALQAHDPHLTSKIVMAINPGRAYYAGSGYLETPADYAGSVEGLVRYEGLDDRVRSYAPRYPSSLPNDELEADYLVYTRPDPGAPYWNMQDLPQFAFLLDPTSDLVPDNFELVYSSEQVVAYEIHRPALTAWRRVSGNAP